ncbi:MAG: YncE family protein [Bacteroidota bacterium]|nr:YncE family protein [Bacteroidota bacterium]
MKKFEFFLLVLQYCLPIKIKILSAVFLLFTINSLVAQNYYLYVASESDDTVSLLKFDGNKINEEERIDVGFYPTEIEGPHGITVDPNGKFWYITLAHGNPYGKIIKYSTKNNTALDQTTLGLFPASMQISKITGFIYCVNFNLHGDMKPSSVSVIDAETMTEITKIKTGSMPHGSRISKDGLKQYSVAMMSGELFEIDALSLNVSRKLDLENHSLMGHSKMNMGNDKMKHSLVKPTWVIPHPNKSLAYVAGNGSNEIIEINLNKWEITKRIKIEKNPYNVEISPNGKFMVATLKGNGKTAIWDLNTGNLIKLIKNSTSVPHGVAISSDSKYAFVSVEGKGGEPGIVDVIDLNELLLIDKVEVGKQAGGIAFWKKEI